MAAASALSLPSLFLEPVGEEAVLSGQSPWWVCLRIPPGTLGVRNPLGIALPPPVPRMQNLLLSFLTASAMGILMGKGSCGVRDAWGVRIPP